VSLDPAVASVLAVVGAVAGLLGLVIAVLALLRLRRLRRAYALLQSADGEESFVDAVGRKTREVEGLRGEVAGLGEAVDRMRRELADAIRHVAVVRYDAFGDMGGRLSFSAALLDDAGDGLVISSINGRSETRTYAKGVKGGSSEAPLSPEEEQAVGWAMRAGARASGRS
jgi:hypothetical protein